MATKKMGRPTDSVKDYMLRVRLDEQTLFELDEIRKLDLASRSQVVRNCISEKYARIKKDKK